jgi:hypothetical protein
LMVESNQSLPIWAVIGDGTYVTQTSVYGDSLTLLRTIWLRVAPVGSEPPFRARVLDTLADLNVADRTRAVGVIPLERGSSYFLQPFNDERLFALSPDGRLSVTITRETTRATNATYVIEGRPVGGAKFRISVPYEARTLAPRDVERAWERAEAHHHLTRDFRTDSAARSAFERVLYRPVHVPAVRAVLIGSDHTIWVQREDADVTARWDVFDGRGKQLGWAELPDGARVKAVTRDGAWGVESYVDEMEQVVKYRIKLK